MKTMAKDLTVQTNNRLTFIDDITGLKNFQLRDLHLSSYVVVHILEGRASFCVHHQQYELAKNDMFICHPDIVLERTTVSLDVELRCTALSPEYVEELAVLASENWDIRRYMEERPILHLSDEDSLVCQQYYTLFKSKMRHTDIPHHRELMNALVQAFIYEFHNMLTAHVCLPTSPRSSAEILFQRFQRLLENTNPKVRNMGYYAEQLNITPKYFSTICKRVSGKRANELITAAVLKEVENALRNTSMSIKEITHRLDFPNESFFCAFVRKHLGRTPQSIRRGT